MKRVVVTKRIVVPEEVMPSRPPQKGILADSYDIASTNDYMVEAKTNKIKNKINGGSWSTEDCSSSLRHSKDACLVHVL